MLNILSINSEEYKQLERTAGAVGTDQEGCVSLNFAWLPLTHSVNAQIRMISDCLIPRTHILHTFYTHSTHILHTPLIHPDPFQVAQKMLSQDALKKEFSAMLETEKQKMKEQIMAVDEKITARAKEEEKSRDAVSKLSKQLQEPSD